MSLGRYETQLLWINALLLLKKLWRVIEDKREEVDRLIRTYKRTAGALAL